MLRKRKRTFARKHQNWTEDQWSKILWSDESKFCLFGSDGKRYVRRPVGTRYDVRYQIPTVKHGGGNVKVWGCFSYYGVGPLVEIIGNMDKVLYKSILADTMLPFAKSKMPRGWIFQHDNDPKHTSGVVKDWLKSSKVHILDWPSQSPNLNPIEHLWKCLNDDVAASGFQAKNKEQLIEKVKIAWNRIAPSLC